MTEMAPWLLIGLTVTEFVLLLAVLLFFKRLKRSEALLEQLQQKQEQFVAKLAFSAELEQELISSFEQRQNELAQLERRLTERSTELEDLLARSRQAVPPRSARPEPAQRRQETPRQIVLNGNRRGHSVKTLAQSSGLSVDEVELILLEARRS